MSEAVEGNNSYASPGLPLKRKRGRPRKDKSLYRVASVRPWKHENLHRAESASAPPGFKGNRVDPVEDKSNGLVGQAITGVVESVFDAGYLLAVRIGNSNTTLRGVVFKPGHFAPVTADNDVAPRVQMIRRNEILLPTQKQSHIGRPRSKERHEQNADYLGNGSSRHPLTTYSVSPQDKCTAIVAAPSVPPVGVRGSVVPVVLEPVNLDARHAAHVAAVKSKQGHTAPDPSQFQTISHVIPKGVHSEGGPFHQGSDQLRQGDEGKSMNMSFPAGKEFQGTSQSSKAHEWGSKETSESRVEDYNSFPEHEANDMTEPLFVEPLRTVHTIVHNQSPFVPNLVGHNGIGRMTELLQAVQENLKESQLRNEHFSAFSKAESNEQKIPGTGFRDEEAAESQKHFHAPSV